MQEKTSFIAIYLIAIKAFTRMKKATLRRPLVHGVLGLLLDSGAGGTAGGVNGVTHGCAHSGTDISGGLTNGAAYGRASGSGAAHGLTQGRCSAFNGGGSLSTHGGGFLAGGSGGITHGGGSVVNSRGHSVSSGSSRLRHGGGSGRRYFSRCGSGNRCRGLFFFAACSQGSGGNQRGEYERLVHGINPFYEYTRKESAKQAG